MQVPEIFSMNEFEILERQELGKGHRSTIKTARHTQSGALLAVKIVR